MGMQTSVYHFYGVNVPKDQWTTDHAWSEGDMLDEVLRATRDIAPDVGRLSAGDYDNDMLFLCIRQPGVHDGIEIEIGEFRVVTHANVSDPGWNAQLLTVASAMGYRGLGVCGWIVCPDVS